MRERARELGGELRMKNDNPGTTVEVLIPAVIASAQETFVTV
jgi:signal transduction histidine kinase